MAKASPAAIREASKAFGDTVESFDGFHVSNFAALPDTLLEVVSVFYLAAEATGMWPTQVSMVQVPLIEKNTGVSPHRPVSEPLPGLGCPTQAPPQAVGGRALEALFLCFVWFLAGGRGLEASCEV